MNSVDLAVNILGNISSLQGALNQAQGGIQGFANKLGGIGTKLSIAISAPIAGLGTTALMAAAGFEQTMNQVQVASQATAEEMQTLQAEALKLGAVTSFSSGEAAFAMLELSKAGFDAGQTLAAVPGVLDLAAAGGIDLAAAAGLTADTLSAFNMEANQSATVANMLAAAANNSTADIGELSYGLQMSSAVAALYGQDLETVSASLALLSNSSLKGSDAGTSLKTMMMSLYAPTDAAAEIMQQLGVSAYDASGQTRPLFDVLEELQGALYGTHQQMVVTGGRTREQEERLKYLKSQISSVTTELANYQSGIAGIAQSEADKVVSVDRLQRKLAALQSEYSGLVGITGDVSYSTKEYTEAERNAMLQTIAGTDGIRALGILLGSTEEEKQKMIEALNQEGSAAAMANARMQGLAGAFEYFKGSVESTLIAAALPYLGFVSDLIRKTADLISSFTQLSPRVQQIAIGVGAFLAALGPGILAFAQFAKIAAFLAGPILPAIGAALGIILSPIGLLVAAVTALGIAIYAFDLGGLRTKIEEFGRGIGSFVDYIGNLKTEGADLESLFAAIPGYMQPLAGAVAGITTAFDDFFASSDWATFAQQVQDSIGNIGAAISGVFSGSYSLGDLGATVAAEVAKIGEAINALFSGGALETLRTDLVAALNLDGLISSLQATFDSALWENLSFSTLISGLQVAAIAAINSIPWAEISLNIQGFVDNITNSINGIDWKTAGLEFGTFVAETVEKVTAFFSSIVSAITDFFSPSQAETFLQDFTFDGLALSIKQALTDMDLAGIGESFAGLATAIKDAISGLWEGFAEGLNLTQLQTEVTSAWASITENLQSTAQNFVDATTGAINGIDWSEAGLSIQGFIDNIAGGINGIKWEEAGIQLGSFVSWITNAISGLFSTESGFAGGVDLSGLAEAVKSALTSVDWAGIGESFLNLGTAVTNAIKGMWEGFESSADLAQIVELYKSAITTVFSNIDTTVEVGATLFRDALVNGINGINWSEASIDFQAFTDSITGWINGIKWEDAGFEFGSFVRETVSAIITAFTPSEDGEGGFFEPLKNAIVNGITNIDWTGIGESLLKLQEAINGAISGFVVGMTDGLGISFPGWDELIDFPEITWPGWDTWIKFPFIFWTGWDKYIVFPTITWPGWEDLIPFPDIPKFPGWEDLWQFLADHMNPLGLMGQGKALGTSYAAGGMTLVGESGPELVVLPRGAQVWNNKDTQSAMGGVSIVVNATVSSEIDMKRLAWEIAKEVKGRAR